MSSSKISAAGSAYSLTFLHPCQKPHHTAKEAKTSSHTQKTGWCGPPSEHPYSGEHQVCTRKDRETVYMECWVLSKQPLKDIRKQWWPWSLPCTAGCWQAKRHIQISRFLFKVLPSLFTILLQMLTFLCPVAEWRPPWSSSSCLLGAEALVGAPG